MGRERLRAAPELLRREGSNPLLKVGSMGVGGVAAGGRFVPHLCGVHKGKAHEE